MHAYMHTHTPKYLNDFNLNIFLISSEQLHDVYIIKDSATNCISVKCLAGEIYLGVIS